MADDDDFSRDVWIGGGIVAPNDVNVAKGYSATEELKETKIKRLEAVKFSLKEWQCVLQFYSSQKTLFTLFPKDTKSNGIASK